VIAPEERLAALRASGAEAFDPEGFGLVIALLDRAEALGGGARDRLRQRAAERIELLDASLRKARADAERDVAKLIEAGAPVGPEVRDAIGRGEIAGVKRAIRGARRALVESRRRVEVPWAMRLHDTARARGARLPPEVARDLDRLAEDGGAVPRDAHARAVAVGSTVATALLRESAESARATIAVARAADNLPDTAGPYNGQVLAARALGAMAAISPAYVSAVVAAIDDLAGAEARITPATPKPARPAKKKRAAAG
jgi:hypothetical protein